MTVLKALHQAAAATGFLSSIFSGLTARASGGPVRQGDGYLVGENGPEYFSPSTSGTIIPNGAMGGGGDAPIVNHVQIGVDGVTDVDSSAEARAKLRRQWRRLTAFLTAR